MPQQEPLQLSPLENGRYRLPHVVRVINQMVHQADGSPTRIGLTLETGHEVEMTLTPEAIEVLYGLMDAMRAKPSQRPPGYQTRPQ